MHGLANTSVGAGRVAGLRWRGLPGETMQQRASTDERKIKRQCAYCVSSVPDGCDQYISNILHDLRQELFKVSIPDKVLAMIT